MGRSVQQTEDYLAKVATSQNMDDLSGMATEIATYVGCALVLCLMTLSDGKYWCVQSVAVIRIRIEG
jgi:hypothetical protein